MKSSTILSLLAVAAVISIPLSGCSSDEEPQSAVAPDYRIGLSTKSVILYGGNDSEEITVGSQGWKLSYISFDDSRSTYVCDLSSSSPFSITKEWLVVDYSDKKLTLSEACENMDDARMAKIVLSNGHVSDTIICYQDYSGISGFPVGVPDPGYVEFPRSGGTVTISVGMSGYLGGYEIWWFDNVMLDNQKFMFPENTPYDPISHTVEWISVDRKSSDHQFVLTVSPNETGYDRTFDIEVKTIVPFHITGRQSAD